VSASHQEVHNSLLGGVRLPLWPKEAATLVSASDQEVHNSLLGGVRLPCGLRRQLHW